MVTPRRELSRILVRPFADFLRRKGWIERPPRSEDEVLRFEAGFSDPNREPVVVRRHLDGRESRYFPRPYYVDGRSSELLAAFVDSWKLIRTTRRTNRRR